MVEPGSELRGSPGMKPIHARALADWFAMRIKPFARASRSRDPIAARPDNAVPDLIRHGRENAAQCGLKRDISLLSWRPC